ncbi:uncharacterized protein LOC110851366 isoform X2 [Folsomia candida]|uniref:Uncharacterized protein n=2 Tax=Folsomia candida TaxID=158441 RepID=A0A226E4E6_FOLCA|nr:uncharacterized protein LOC110851366 isoform X2 [Folsomia candida]OXA52463.1 hypothetical protein Fcan01_12367 [Folsomia candida]
MASGGDSHSRPPAQGSGGPSSYLLDPNSSPRVKSISVALTSWCELHLLCLRAHDLISTAHLNRLEHISEGLYQLFETLRAFEKRYSAMLVRVNQYPEPAHIVFFAKTFNERIFHAGESIETMLSSNLARAAQTRAEFRLQLQESERSLLDYEAEIYESVASANFGRSKVQKVFLPQPHPLEYIPLSIQPFVDSSMGRSSPENGGALANSLVFLRNRRRQLLSLMQTLNESRFQSDFTSLDVRDFHHEVELVESEMGLVTNLQRIVTTVRMMEEARGNITPTRTPQSYSESNVAALFRETVELFQPIRGPANTHQGLPTDGRSIGIPYLNNTLGEDHSRRNLNVDRSLAFSSLSSVNINSSSNPNNHPPISNELPLPPPSRLSEPLQHSWVLSGDRSNDRARSGASQVTSRGRWFTTDHLSHSNLNDHTPRQSCRWSDGRQEPEYTALGEDYMTHEIPSRNILNSSSAFTRVPRNISNITQNIRSRASSVAEVSDFSSHHNNENELNFDTPDQLLAQTVMTGYDRQNVMLQDMMTRVIHLGMSVRNSGSIVNRNNSLLTDLVIAVDEINRNVARIQEDVAILKSNSNTQAAFGPDHYSAHIPTRNRSDDNWRNIDSQGQNERSTLNMLNHRSWESSRSSALPRGENSAFRANMVDMTMPHEPLSHSRYPLSAAAMERRREITSATAPPPNSEQYETPTNSSNCHMLNNQIPPGNRANNYWDNFKSYSRLNLLSDSKTNIPGLSPCGGLEDQLANALTEDLFQASSPSVRRDSRGDRSQGSSTIRSSLSANFVENIGQKKRNKDQKKQFSALTSGSPLHSSSSNSSAAGSLNDLIVRSRSSNVESHDRILGSSSREPAENRVFSPSHGTRISSSSGGGGVERPLDSDGDRRNTNVHGHVMSPPSSLEVDLVSRDEFLQLNSGAGSSASGNGKSDDGGGASSSSSKKELEKLLGTSDNEEFHVHRASGDHGSWPLFDASEIQNDNAAAAAKPEPDWLWPDGEVPESSHNADQTSVKKSSREMDRNE